MNNILRDLAFGIRLLVKNPVFAGVAIITLALGIGANTAIFSLVNSILLRPLPYKDSERLVALWNAPPRSGEAASAAQQNNAPMSLKEFLDWKEQKQIFEEVGAYWHPNYNLTGDGEPKRVRGFRSSLSMLSMLGVKPDFGRLATPEEEQASGERVAMVTYGLWQRRYGGNRDVIGKTLTLDNNIYTIIGVLPKDFHFNDEWEVWIPLRLDISLVPEDLDFLSVVGKLRPGLGVEQARTEADAVAARLRQERGTDGGVRLVTLRDQVVGDTRPHLLVLLSAVGFVLLIACTTVANLLLTHAAARNQEIAIRLALGASRGRLVRQLLTESLALSLVSGVLGLLIGVLGTNLLAVAAKENLPRVEEISIDGIVLAFTFGISVLTGLIFGLAPALRASRPDLHETLKEGGRQQNAGAGKNRLRATLVVIEIAVSLILLVGAGLLIRSFVQLLDTDKGFNADNVLTTEMSLSPVKYSEPQQEAAFLRQVVEQISTINGVEAVALVSNLPLSGAGARGDFGIEGQTWPKDGEPEAEKIAASSDYFRALRILLIKGRTFNERDDERSPHVVVISETMAKRFFQNQDPIGKRVDLNWGEPGWNEVVGVVGDIKNQSLEATVLPQIYFPSVQHPEKASTMGMKILIRTTVNPTSLIGPVREQVLKLDKDQPLSQVRTMEQIIAESVGERRLATWMVGGFALVALFLAAVGIYGIMSYAVKQRTHEIGIRVALGAQPWDVLKLIMRQGMLLTLLGIVIGLGGALAVGRIISSLLYGVTKTDFITFASVSLLLTGAALLACYIPARRATKVDPMHALRHG
jgi:putative ABC transport system permease protein